MISPLALRVQVASALFGLAAMQAAASPITIVPSSLIGAWAGDDFGNSASDDTSTEFGTRSVSVTYGRNSSTAQIDLQDSGSGALLDFDFYHVRVGESRARAGFQLDPLRFTVGEFDISYSLSGLYSMTGSANRLSAQTILQDTGTGEFLFYELQDSDDKADESFRLGAPKVGGSNNSTSGSLTGTLLAGHSYAFRAYWSVLAMPRTDSGATATGCLTLSIGDATGGGQCGLGVVPEPGSLALVGAALGGVVAMRRRKPASSPV